MLIFLFLLLSFREHKESFSPSPNPSPRKSLEEKDMMSQQEGDRENDTKQTSPVAKIRQFIGIGNDTEDSDASKFANEQSREEVLNKISSGRKIVFIIVN